MLPVICVFWMNLGCFKCGLDAFRCILRVFSFVGCSEYIVACLGIY